MTSLRNNETNITRDKFDLTAPSIIIDIVIFTIYKEKLCIILVNKIIEWKNYYILPEWYVRKGYTLEENFDDILRHRTWIEWVYKEQLHTFWDTYRPDSNSHFVSISYFALINKNKFLKDVDLTKINIIEYNNIDKVDIWYDHKNIIKFARQRLKFRLEHTTISKDILPPKFTLSQMQKTYEIIFWEELDKRNFRRNVEQLKIIKFTWEYDKISSNRPAKIYEFTNKDLQYLNEDIINFNI
ncbi:MAG: Nudix hydrolase [uncultured bacterium (gcode 4)]|uniref:Nudix hydrolase n=1 Tax=uncultured bacterium (gcode 4) TaxID=1234023 RepID=K2FYZ0_9BACT|nr:MAG: Nudix hydrolase [uncultured bacterium (gcode 4)]